MTTTVNRIVILAATLVLSVAVSVAQDMTREEWQEEMNRITQQVNDLKARATELDASLASLREQSARLDADIKKAEDELYALVGSTAADAARYRTQIDAAENTANNLLRLSDAELLARSGEVTALENEVKGLWENRLSLIPEFWDRLTALNDKVASLKTTLAGSGQVYTVGTWSRDRDCLWNIAKKPSIYSNAWLWPKIWQGNRDQIRDPDVISPGQKLKIPPKADLTQDERSAANSYYRRKAGQ